MENYFSRSCHGDVFSLEKNIWWNEVGMRNEFFSEASCSYFESVEVVWHMNAGVVFIHIDLFRLVW